MPSSNVSWGIEVGAGAIKAVKLEAGTGSGGPTLAEFLVIPHKKVLSTPDLDQSDALRVAMGELVNQADLTGATVAMSVPGHSAFARFAKLPPVEPKKVPDIVKFEAVQQIPFPIDDVEWDYQTFASPDSPEVEVGIFAITRERIMERLTMYEEVGITPDFVTLSPVAVYNAIAHDLAFNEQTPGTILLDIGTTSTDLVICEAGRVWIRTFPIGGHHFTEALVNKFQLGYPKAEKLKKEAESTQHARHVFQAMRPVFGDLAQDVQRSIGYYQSLHKDAKLTRLIGLGSTFRLPGLRKFLKQQLQLDVYRLEGFKRLTLEGARAGELQAQALNLSTAYGLALQGLGEATLDVNLMPVTVVRTAMWRRKIPWFGVAAGVAVAGSGAMFIRPFIDRTQIAANPKPATVTEVAGRFRQLKSDANDVTEPTPNLAAADILGLLDRRAFHAMMLMDVGRMFADADALAAKWPEGALAAGAVKPPGPAYVLQNLKSSYVPPKVEAALATTPTPAKLSVTATLVTEQPDAQRFKIRTIDQWLRDHAKRTGVPYEIVFVEAKVRGSLKIPDAPKEDPGASTPGRVAPGGRAAATLMGEGGGTGEHIPGANVQLIGAGPRPGAPSAEEQAADRERALAREAMNKISPIPPGPGPTPGATVTTVEVTWEMILTPPAAGGST
ncbi:MAG: type IV pilus assembly protein PilM [Phycisphaerales bacterium]